LTPPVNQRFANAGYDSSNFVLLMGTVFAIEIGYLIIFMFIPLTKRCAEEQYCKGWWADFLKGS
jgi:hypothetical protein